MLFADLLSPHLVTFSINAENWNSDVPISCYCFSILAEPLITCIAITVVNYGERSPRHPEVEMS